MNPGRRWLPASTCIVYTLLSSLPASAEDVVALYAPSNAIYKKVLDGARQRLSCSVHVLEMTADRKGEPEIASAAVTQKNPRVLLVIGGTPLRWSLQRFPKLPIVFAAVSQPLQEALKSPWVTGVLITPSPADSLRAYREMLPRVRKVSVVYSSEWSTDFIAEATQQGQKLGFQLFAHAVENPRDLLPALEEAFAQAEVFWMLQDPILLRPELIEKLLILQVTRRVGLLTYTNALVKKGALAAYYAGYEDQGKQAGQLVMSILGGKKPADLPVQSPAGMLSINVSTAQRIGLKLPEALFKKQNLESIH